MASISNCTEVSEACPVSATLYGYVPNMAGNTAIDTVFGVAMLAHIILLAFPPKSDGFRPRHWPYSIFAFIGVVLEFLGYLSRIWMDSDVWNEAATGVQLICIILGPTFLVAAIYLVLSHLIRELGPQYSRLPAKYYSWVFVTIDIACILIQALGGGLAAAQGSKSNASTIKAGGDLILVGIVLQVAVMVVVCGLVLEYAYRRRAALVSDRINKTALEHKLESSESDAAYGQEQPKATTSRFKWLMALLAVAYVLVFVRSIYRIYEFADGFGGPAMRKEVPFLVLDGTMVALATICLTIAHPALLFPEMCRRRVSREVV